MVACRTRTRPTERVPRFLGQPISWSVTPDAYAAIRHAWLTHVSAEAVLAKPFPPDVWKTRMALMVSVFSDGRAMEPVPTGDRREGQSQADAFCRTFIGSLEGMEWVTRSLVSGPQGVLDLERELGGLTGAGAIPRQ